MICRERGPTDATLRLARQPVAEDQRLPAGAGGPRRRHCAGQPAFCRCRHLSLQDRYSLARSARALRRLEGDTQALPQVVSKWRFCSCSCSSGARCGRRIHVDRLDQRPCAPTQRRRPKKDGESQAIGRSRGGPTTKIHAIVDALGNPVALSLTPGQAADITQAVPLLDQVEPEAFLADKGYDADALIATLEERGHQARHPAQGQSQSAARNRLRIVP